VGERLGRVGPEAELALEHRLAHEARSLAHEQVVVVRLGTTGTNSDIL
jgi:hypothetical protein